MYTQHQYGNCLHMKTPILSRLQNDSAHFVEPYKENLLLKLHHFGSHNPNPEALKMQIIFNNRMKLKNFPL